MEFPFRLRDIVHLEGEMAQADVALASASVWAIASIIEKLESPTVRQREIGDFEAFLGNGLEPLEPEDERIEGRRSGYLADVDRDVLDYP